MADKINNMRKDRLYFVKFITICYLIILLPRMSEESKGQSTQSQTSIYSEMRSSNSIGSSRVNTLIQSPILIRNRTVSQDSAYDFTIPLKSKKIHAPVVYIDFPSDFDRIFHFLNVNVFDLAKKTRFYKENICLAKIWNVSQLGSIKNLSKFTKEKFFNFESSFYHDQISDSIIFRCEVENQNPNLQKFGINKSNPL